MPSDPSWPPPMMHPATHALYLLADGRFPMGGHVHSGGVESAMQDGRITSTVELEGFVIGRLQTVGLVDAALAAATVHHLELGDEESCLTRLDREAAARLPAEPLRVASRRQGRQLVRVAQRCWPGEIHDRLTEIHDDGPHLSIAMGAVVSMVGGTPFDAATIQLHHCATTPMQAAVRIGGIDPYEVAAMTARLGTVQTELAARAVVASTLPLERLPMQSGPLIEIAAVHHADAPTRLFAT